MKAIKEWFGFEEFTAYDAALEGAAIVALLLSGSCGFIWYVILH